MLAAGSRRRARLAPAAIVTTLLLSLAMAACGGPSIPSLAPGQRYYVSLGDSYASGFQQTGPKSAGNTRNGFAYQIPSLGTAKGYHLKLVNFACAGATTNSMISSPGCPSKKRGPGAPSYGKLTQFAAAMVFVHAHPGQIGLITMSIGANDYIPCQNSNSPITCLQAVTQFMQTQVQRMVSQLRAAVGPAVPIVGTTYPDVILAYYLSKDPNLQDLAAPSVDALRTLINPALQAAYTGGGGTFVDVTTWSGAYIPWNVTTNLPPYGTIPLAVARVCQLTFMCKYQNIHPTNLGYRLIADLVVGALPPAPGASGS